MPDYREMYFIMMHESAKAIEILVRAQQRCEELYLDDKQPELYLFETKNQEPQ